MKHHAEGFTLIELLVTIGLLSVLMLMAAPSFIEYQRSSMLSSQVNNFVGAIHAAKSEAIKRNTHSYLVPIANNNWSSGWMLYTDDNMSGSYEAAHDTKIMEYPHVADILEITANGTANENSGRYISFNASGYPRTLANAMGNFSMTFKVRNYDTANNTRLVSVSKTGRVRTCRPAQDSDCTVPTE